MRRCGPAPARSGPQRARGMSLLWGRNSISAPVYFSHFFWGGCVGQETSSHGGKAVGLGVEISALVRLMSGGA